MTDEQLTLYTAVRMQFPHQHVRVSTWHECNVCMVAVQRRIGQRILKLVKAVSNLELDRSSHIAEYVAHAMRKEFGHAIEDEFLGKLLK